MPDWQVREDLAPRRSSSALCKATSGLACMEAFLRSQALDNKVLELVICSEPCARGSSKCLFILGDAQAAFIPKGMTK